MYAIFNFSKPFGNVIFFRGGMTTFGGGYGKEENLGAGG
jgi:hypothetical protein